MKRLKQVIELQVLFAFLQSIASRDVVGRKVVAGDRKEEVTQR